MNNECVETPQPSEETLLLEAQGKISDLRRELASTTSRLHFPDRYPSDYGAAPNAYWAFFDYLQSRPKLDLSSIWRKIVDRVRKETRFASSFDNLGVDLTQMELSMAVPKGVEVVDNTDWGKGFLALDEGDEAGGVLTRRPKVRDRTRGITGSDDRFLKRLWEFAHTGYVREHSVAAHEIQHLRPLHRKGEPRPVWSPMDHVSLRLVVALGLQAVGKLVSTDRLLPRKFNHPLYEAFAYLAAPDCPGRFLKEGVLVKTLMKTYGFDQNQSRAAVLAILRIKSLASYAVETGKIPPEDPLANFEQSTATLIYQWVGDGRKFDKQRKVFPATEERIDEYCQKLGFDRNSPTGKRVLAHILRVGRLTSRLDVERAKLIAQEVIDEEINQELGEPRVKLRIGVPPFYIQISSEAARRRALDLLRGIDCSYDIPPPVFFPADEEHPYTVSDMVGYFYESGSGGNTTEWYRVHFKMSPGGIMRLALREKIEIGEQERILILFREQLDRAVVAEQTIGPDRHYFRGFPQTSVLGIAADESFRVLPIEFRFEVLIAGAGLQKFRSEIWGYCQAKEAVYQSGVGDLPSPDIFLGRNWGEIEECLLTALRDRVLFDGAAKVSDVVGVLDYFLGEKAGNVFWQEYENLRKSRNLAL